jgi:hypothetical protein
MKTIHFFSLLAVVTVAMCACEKQSDLPTTQIPPPIMEKDLAFAKQDIQITADADRRYTDRDITLTMKCLPLVSGVGRIMLDGNGNTQTWSWRSLAPVQDTVIQAPSGTLPPNLETSVHFTANDTCTMTWRIRLDSPVTYSFLAYARIDSVAVPGLDHLVTPWSTEAKIMSRNKMGYNEVAGSLEALYLR